MELPPQVEFTPIKDIENAQEALQGMRYEQIKAESYPLAWEKVGELCKDEIQKAAHDLADSIKKPDLKALEKQRAFLVGKAEELSKSNDEKDKIVSSALREYLESLDQWAEGAGLKEEFPDKYQLLALGLQNDNVGCETVMVKEGDSVYFIHTEEDFTDPEDSVDPQLRVSVKDSLFLEFAVGNDKPSYLFTYSRLMYSAFGYNGGKVFANDFLAIDEPGYNIKKEGGYFGNTVLYLAWRLAETHTPEELVKKLGGPFLDGYAVNCADANGNITSAEFYGRQVATKPYGEESSLIHTNLPKNIQLGEEIEEADYYKKREERLGRFVRHTKGHPNVFREGARLRLGGSDESVANNFTLASMNGSIGPGGVELKVTKGPASKRLYKGFSFKGNENGLEKNVLNVV